MVEAAACGLPRHDDVQPRVRRRALRRGRNRRRPRGLVGALGGDPYRTRAGPAASGGYAGVSPRIDVGDTVPADPAAARNDAVVNLSKRRGFVYPSSEIYGGPRSAWDFGPPGGGPKGKAP